MSTVIFKTENAVFKFALKEVKERLIVPESEYNHDEVFKLLDFISTDSDKTILNPDDHDYFGFVALDLTSKGIGTVTCKICDKIYDSGQLKEFAVGLGRSPFNINREQKGGIRLFDHMPVILDKEKVCQGCRDKTGCDDCAFNNQL
jgi:hypothetical protein